MIKYEKNMKKYEKNMKIFEKYEVCIRKNMQK